MEQTNPITVKVVSVNISEKKEQLSMQLIVLS